MRGGEIRLIVNINYNLYYTMPNFCTPKKVNDTFDT